MDIDDEKISLKGLIESQLQEELENIRSQLLIDGVKEMNNIANRERNEEAIEIFRKIDEILDLNNEENFNEEYVVSLTYSLNKIRECLLNQHPDLDEKIRDIVMTMGDKMRCEMSHYDFAVLTRCPVNIWMYLLCLLIQKINKQSASFLVNQKSEGQHISLNASLVPSTRNKSRKNIITIFCEYENIKLFGDHLYIGYQIPEIVAMGVGGKCISEILVSKYIPNSKIVNAKPLGGWTQFNLEKPKRTVPLSRLCKREWQKRLASR